MSEYIEVDGLRVGPCMVRSMIEERDQLRAELKEAKDVQRNIQEDLNALVAKHANQAMDLAQERERVNKAGAEAIRKMCQQWLDEAKELPDQYEHPSKGCSTYNWQTHYARAGISYADRISALSAGEGGCDATDG